MASPTLNQIAKQLAARMLRGIVALATPLRLHTVAEGVESREEAFFVRAAGVDCGQGWFWSKSLSGARAARLLEQGGKLKKQGRAGVKISKGF